MSTALRLPEVPCLPEISVREGVYPPAEDSWLLQRAALRFARGRFLDLGCGTGIIGVTAALLPRVSQVVFTDVNPAALECARENAAANGVVPKSVFLRSNLFSRLRGELFDVIAFNPPYLPTARGEKLRGSINGAFDGGATGRRVTDRFIKAASSRLKDGGVLLLVSSSLASSALDGNGNEETRAKLEAEGFSVSLAAEDSFFFEKLAVFRASPAK